LSSGLLGPVFDAGEPASGRTVKVTRNLLMPKNIRWRKPHRPAVKPFHHCTKWKYRGEAQKGNKPIFGKYALVCLEEAWISNKAIEVMRRTIVRTMERKGKYWIRVFPHSAITSRIAEARMGAGKGSIDYWVAAVRPGYVLFEMDGVPEAVARTAFRKCHFKMPCQSKMIVKTDGPSRFELGLAGVAAEKKKNVDPRTLPQRGGKP